MARIAIIPGDGIGADVTREAVKVIGCVAAQTGTQLDLVDWNLGAQRYLDTGVTITREEMAELKSGYDAIFLGAMGDPRVPDNVHARDILLGLRFELDLYINLRPVQLLESSMSPLRNVQPQDVDLVIFRENTEGVYVGMGGSLRRARPTRSPSRRTSTRARAWSASSARRSTTRARATAAASRSPTRPTPCPTPAASGDARSPRSARSTRTSSATRSTPMHWHWTWC
jgi:isocitrate/isopropylmalate dehydrogenase